MKKTKKKLHFSKQTVRVLQDSLDKVRGGGPKESDFCGTVVCRTRDTACDATPDCGIVSPTILPCY